MCDDGHACSFAPGCASQGLQIEFVGHRHDGNNELASVVVESGHECLEHDFGVKTKFLGRFDAERCSARVMVIGMCLVGDAV